MDVPYVLPPKKRPRRHFSVPEKEHILNIFKKCRDEHPEYTKSQTVEFASKASGAGISSIYKIMREYYTLNGFIPPKPYHRARAILDNIDDDTRAAIRQKVDSLVSRNEPPTIQKVLVTVNEDENLQNFKKSTLRKLLKEIRGEVNVRVQPSTSTTAPATTDPLIKLEEPSCSRIQEPGIDTTLEFLPEPSEQPVVNVAPKPKPTYKGRKDRIYCRLCLKTSNKNSLTPLSVVDFNYPGKSDAFKKKKAEKVEEIQKMIKFCLPFFDSLTFNPIICSICLARLRSSYDFANECLKNQRLVEKYADMYGATERIININEMVESKFALSEDESESDTDTDNTTQSIPKVTRSSARVSHQKTGEKYSHEDGPATKKQKIYNESQEENSLASSNEDTPCIKTEPHEEDDTILKEFLTQDMPTRDTDPDNIDNIADESMIKIEPEYIDSPDFIKAEPVDDLHVENEIFNKRTGIGTDIQEQHSHFPKTEKDVLDTGTIVPSTTREPVFFNVDSSLETTTSDVN